ncbi:MAG: histidine kinase [Bacteroidota bacterium]
MKIPYLFWQGWRELTLCSAFLLFAWPLLSQSSDTSIDLPKLIQQAYDIRSKDKDSLQRLMEKIETYQADEPNVQLYLDYFNGFLVKEDTTAFRIFQQVQQQAVLSGDYPLAAKAGQNIGVFHRKQDNYRAAEDAIEQGLDYLEQTVRFSYFNLNQVRSRLLVALSGIHHMQGNYEKGLRFGHEAERVAEANDLPYEKMATAINLGALYGELSSPDNELGTEADRIRYDELTRQYLEKAVVLAEADNRRSAGICYGNLGTYYSIKEQYDTSNYYLKKAFERSKEVRFFPLSVRSLRTITLNFRYLEDIDSTIYYNKLTLQYADSSGRIYTKANALISSANIYELKDDIPMAIASSTEAARLADSIQNFRIAANAYDHLHTLYQKQGDFEAALRAYEKHIVHKDSMVTQANYAEIEKLRAEYETEQKEVQIASLEQQSQIQSLQISQQRIWLFTGLALGALLLLLGWVAYRQLRLRKRQDELKLQQKLLRVQMNPHFLYNALNAIQKLIYWNDDRKKTADCLAQFSQLTRQILEFNQHEFISLEQELSFIENYLEVQRMRYDPPFTYEVEIDDSLEIDELRIPPMITQPFLENAIEHGLAQKSDPGHLLLKISQQQGQLQIVIEDNGVGIAMATTLTDTAPHQSLATTITQNRLLMLRKSLKKQARLWIQDLREEGQTSGTRVNFLLPLIYG